MKKYDGAVNLCEVQTILKGKWNKKTKDHDLIIVMRSGLILETEESFQKWVDNWHWTSESLIGIKLSHVNNAAKARLGKRKML